MSPRESRPGERAANDLADGRIGAQPTARPRPVSLIGAALYHSLIANGYAITGVCRACGAPLTNHKSVAAGIGPVCGKRVVADTLPQTSPSATVAVANDATRRRDRIKLLLSTMTTTTEKIAELLEAAQADGDHRALGYASWTAYVAGEYAESLAGLSAAARRPAVAALAEGGLSTRAIAEIAGVGQSTVGRDLQVTRSGSPGEAGPVRSAKLEQRREFFDSDEEMRDAEVMADASDDDFEAALTAAREQDDLSRENVTANLPAKRVTGTDGKSYSARAEPRKPRRSPLPDSYRRAVWELQKSVERLERLHADDRFTTNRALLDAAYRHPVTDSLDRHAELLAELIGGVR